MTIEQGTRLGPYRVIAPLGQGGMASVYKAERAALGRIVALKVLHLPLTGDPEFVARFQREALTVARLRHPSIVRIFDFDRAGQVVYMAMQYVDGGTLKAKLTELSARGRRMPPATALRVLSEVAAALDHAHARGIVHRDVKPSNMLLFRTGQGVVADFGIAKILSETQHTRTGVGLGTPAYMSPEQGLGREIDPRSDVYSLGVVAYELLTGTVPFTADTPLAVVLKHVHEPPPPPSRFDPEIGANTEHALLRALAKNVDDRYASAGEFCRELTLAVGGGPAGSGATRIFATAKTRAVAAAAPGIGRRVLLGLAVASVAVAAAVLPDQREIVSGLARVVPSPVGSAPPPGSTVLRAPASPPRASPVPLSAATQAQPPPTVTPAPTEQRTANATQASAASTGPATTRPTILAISGTVRRAPTGVVLPGVRVSAFGGSFAATASAKTDESGHYVLGVPPGVYRLESSPQAGIGLIDQASVTSVTDRDVLADITFTTGSIAGSVADASTGAPIAGASVLLYRQTPGPTAAVPPTFNWFYTVSTDASGRYSADVSYGTYRVEFHKPGLALRWWKDGISTSTASEVVLSGASVTGIDARLRPAVTVTGNVSAVDGSPLPYSSVAAYRGGGAACCDWVSSVQTDVKGDYRLELPAGTYRISMLGGVFYSSYRLQFWPDAATFESASDLVLTSGTVSGINALLRPLS